ncbi:phosphopantetheine-binding protein [Imhoffiella purpurea]|uniref:Acyl carrier protein n=1 Tax=Imhoffiella purpurea TaxID=1249627 RepID=W9VJJ5_9GAMM|nr:phosphopantetheine-binding protein [Imhoffiella purpurea]EXJ16237.1 acyl carrier protein [Imhoffiella purpurea]
METLAPLEQEVAQLIIETLHLDDMQVSEIDPTAPLFGEGLGLDSIDALELSLAVTQKYGITISSQDPNIRSIFASLRDLSAHIAANRSR